MIGLHHAGMYASRDCRHACITWLIIESWVMPHLLYDVLCKMYVWNCIVWSDMSRHVLTVSYLLTCHELYRIFWADMSRHVCVSSDMSLYVLTRLCMIWHVTTRLNCIVSSHMSQHGYVSSDMSQHGYVSSVMPCVTYTDTTYIDRRNICMSLEKICLNNISYDLSYDTPYLLFCVILKTGDEAIWQVITYVIWHMCVT